MQAVINYIGDNYDIFRRDVERIKEFNDDKPRDHNQWDTHIDPDIYAHVESTEAWTLSCPDMSDGNWYHFPIVVNGTTTTASQKLIPETAEFFDMIDGLYMVGFSLMFPRSMIIPHTDNPHVKDTDKECGQWTYHLGIICPPHCYVIQHGFAIPERNGHIIRFRTCDVHGAVNMSDYTRIIMFISFVTDEPTIKKPLSVVDVVQSSDTSRVQEGQDDRDQDDRRNHGEEADGLSVQS